MKQRECFQNKRRLLIIGALLFIVLSYFAGVFADRGCKKPIQPTLIPTPIIEFTPTPVKQGSLTETPTPTPTPEVPIQTPIQTKPVIPTPYVKDFYDWDEQLKVHFIDVGQGDCILVETDGEYLLIDAGDTSQDETVLNYLDSLGIKKLNYVIATHAHYDHIGGMDSVLKKYPVEKLIMTEHTIATEAYYSLMGAIEYAEIEYEDAVAGTTYMLGEAYFTVISPVGEYSEEDLNNWSVCVKLQFGNTSFLFTGDIERSAENDLLLTYGDALQADVLKVAHHGSRTSSAEDFLDVCQPKYAVIMCGKDNEFSLPDDITIRKMSRWGITCYRTDYSGTVIALSDGNEVLFTTQYSE